MPIEIEAKVRVPHFTQVRRRLIRLHAVQVRDTIETNVIWDRPDEELRRKNARLRLRNRTDLLHGQNDIVLTYKGPREKHQAYKSRPEYELHVDSLPDATLLLKALGYEEVFRYEKRRESWALADCVVELDSVPHLGRFVEVEATNEDAIEAVLDKLGLADEPVIQRGYVGLLRKHLRTAEDTPRTTITLADCVHTRALAA